MKRNTILLMTIILSVHLSCQDKPKKNDIQNKNSETMGIDLNDIDFNNGLEKKLVDVKLDLGESEFSKYLKAYSTLEVESFRLGKLKFESTYEINGIKVPNKSYVSFVVDQENGKTILTTHVRHNFIGDEKTVLNILKEEFGEPNLLNNDDSSNTFRGLKNYVWSNIQKNKSLIISQKSEGSAVQIENGNSQKIFTVLLYIVDDIAIINYPNGQKQTILDRLLNRFSY